MWITRPSCSYEIYVNPNGTDLREFNLTKIATTDILNPGYHQISVEKTELTGDKFAIVVKQIALDKKANLLLEPQMSGTFYEYVDSQYGSRYGTLRSEVDSFINVGQDVLFDMDWAGARQMREKAGEDVVTIYLLPPSIKELRKRLEGRGTDSKEVIDKRMGIILEKVSHWNEFDYVIVNVSLQETVAKIQRIISGERMRRVRQVGLKGFVKELVNEAKEEA